MKRFIQNKKFGFVVVSAIPILIAWYILDPLTSEPSLPEAELSPEEYEVYSAFFNEGYAKAGFLTIVIQPATCSRYNRDNDSTSTNKSSFFSPEDSEVWNDYLVNNKQSARLSSKFDHLDYNPSNSQFRVVILSYKEQRQMYRAGRFGIYLYDYKYPHSVGIITLSRVGFNREKNQAILSRDHHAPPPYLGWGSNGYVFLLAKQNGKWVVVKKQRTWVS